MHADTENIHIQGLEHFFCFDAADTGKYYTNAVSVCMHESGDCIGNNSRY